MNLTTLLTSSWAVLASGLPNPSPTPPPGISEDISTILGWVMWFCIALCIACLMGAGVSLAWAQRNGEGMDLGRRAAMPLVGVSVIAASVAVISGIAS